MYKLLISFLTQIENCQKMIFKPIFKITFLIVLLTTFTFFSSCNSKNANENKNEIKSFHDTFRIDPSLKEQADLIMEGQEEVYTFDDILNKDTTNKRKKSSTVKIIVSRDNLNDIKTVDELRCVANLKNDTLNIDISINSGFSGTGVFIKCTEEKFSANIYEFTDIIDPSEKEPILTTENQKLALNKSNFVTGDSLYGYIYLRMVDDRKVKYYANGFFRAKITSRD
jgi:hypothetical protein